MPRFTDDDRNEIIEAVLGHGASNIEPEPERSITMDAVKDVGITKEEKPCTCGRPRSTIMVPGSTLVYKPAKGDEKPITQTMSVTICMSCDGGIEWVVAK